MIDRDKFLSKVRVNDLTCEKVADKLEIDPSTLSGRLNGRSSFTLAEVESLREILKLSNRDISEIFLNPTCKTARQ